GKLVTVLDVSALAKAAAASSSQPLRQSVESQAPATILVVDDALTTRTMISLLLEQSGYRTLTAPDGGAALSILASEPVDVLVSDVELPILGGLELVRRVRASPRFTALPIILLTTLDAPADRASGAEAGANAYLVKSAFEPSRFLSMVAEFVG